MVKRKAILMARVSTVEQDTERQIADLTKYAESRNLTVVGTITEKVSGALKNENRKDVQELLKRARKYEFDCVVISELSRLSRSAYQLQRIIEELTDLKISVIVQTLNIETLNEKGERTPLVDLMVAIIGQIGQMERYHIIERVKSGMAQAKRNGKHCGRPKGSKMNNENLLQRYSHVVKDLKKQISTRKVAAIHSVSLGTVMKVRKAMYAST